MKPTIMKGKKGDWYLSDQKFVKLKAASLVSAFREALSINPDLDKTVWIDENDITQKVLFDI